MTILRDLYKTLGTNELAMDWLKGMVDVHEDIIADSKKFNTRVLPYWDGIANEKCTLVYIVTENEELEYILLSMGSFQFQSETESMIGLNDVDKIRSWLDKHRIAIIGSGNTTIGQVKLNT